jgi:dihydroorotate dehydrogenase electron transfer subunit
MRQFTAAVRANQFFSLRCSAGYDPLLRRPFAFSGFDPATAQARCIFLQRGPTTTALAGLAPGAQLDLLGPLGTLFPMPAAGQRPVLVSGGIGLGPILFLHARLAAMGAKPLFVYGARQARLVPAALLPADAVVCTDDGSLGEQGNVLAVMERRGWTPSDLVYGCGPGPMLTALAKACLAANRTCIVSVEQHMACGVGACAGCTVKAADESYLRACCDGPIFDARALSWE